MTETDSAAEMWSAFASAFPELVDEDTEYGAWHFCDNQNDADELADLVVRGTKRATAGALWSYEADNEPLPRVGDLNVITDWSGRARCVIRTVSVEVIPFDAVTPEFAQAEGEGDGSLAYWQEVHRAAFSREFEGTGRVLERDMPVVCERFEVVFVGEPGEAVQ